MKKLILTALLVFAVSYLYAVPPMPGSGLTHDGSLRWETGVSGEAQYARSSSLNKALKASSVSTTGTKKILVILAKFPGDTRSGKTYDSLDFKAVHTNDFFEDFFGDYTDPAPAKLTMAEYYKKISRYTAGPPEKGLGLEFHVMGPYWADYDYAYYGGNNVYGNDVYPYLLVKEMLENAKADMVKPVPDDIDNCGVIVVHAGPGEENGGVTSDYIWSHSDNLSDHGVSGVTIEGKVFDKYVLGPEYIISGGRTEPTIGVFCHEFGHVLGLPDSYDTSGATAGLGQWSLMAGGSWGSLGRNSSGTMTGSDPAPMLAWELVKMGWMEEENITPAAGKSNYIEFGDINDASKVYRVDLSDDQYLTLEGKKENSTGTGMYVMETGLLITQLHKTVLDKYWVPVNRINYGSYRVHGSMVVEAVASNYKTNGLGDLWRGSREAYRLTTTALFRRDTLTSVSPSGSSSMAEIPFLPVFFSTIIGSGIVISILLIWYYGRRKLCIAIACAVCAACISMSCVISSGSGGGTYDTGPNTNYYTDITNVHSKTGISGITIYDIKVNSDGSGSFWVKKD